MLCRRLTGRDGRPRRGSPARRRFSCGQLVRLGRSGQEDHHIRWHTAADAVCAPTQAPVSKSNALLRLLRDAAYLRLSIPMRTLRHRLHWSARIRGAVRRLRRTALGDTASVLVFIVLVFKQEASVRVHAVLPLHTVLPGPEPGWLCDQPGRDQSWRPSPALLCQAPARRGAVASGTAAPPRRDAAIVHRRTGDLSLRLRRQRRRRPPRRRPPRCPVRAAASSRGERG